MKSKKTKTGKHAIEVPVAQASPIDDNEMDLDYAGDGSATADSSYYAPASSPPPVNDSDAEQQDDVAEIQTVVSWAEEMDTVSADERETVDKKLKRTTLQREKRARRKLRKRAENAQSTANLPTEETGMAKLGGGKKAKKVKVRDTSSGYKFGN